MIMKARFAMIKAGLKAKGYSNVIRHYSEYKSAIEENFGSVDNFWRYLGATLRLRMTDHLLG